MGDNTMNNQTIIDECPDCAYENGQHSYNCQMNWDDDPICEQCRAVPKLEDYHLCKHCHEWEYETSAGDDYWKELKEER